jgi:multidrug efflux system membrane fusion protein
MLFSTGKHMNQKSKRTFYILLAICCIFIIAGLVYSSLKTTKAKKRNHTIAVEVAQVLKNSAPTTLIAPGRIEAVESVNVRSQVSGILQKINFKSGANVSKNQLLFQIDDAGFVTTLEQAKANLAKDQAQLEETKRDVDRLKSLVKNNFVSKQAYTKIGSELSMQSAVIKSDQEKIKEAQLKVDYSKIRSPIDGLSGNVTVKVGDLITIANTSPLVTINKINPVYASFNVAQKELPKILEYQQKNPLKVDVYSENSNELLGQGVLDFIDNTIDTQSGTILLKGLINNDKKLLWPAQLVSIKMYLHTDDNALVVPSTAVKNDNNGQYVFLVTGNKVKITPVKASQRGKISIIRSGLKLGDRVVSVVSPNLTEQSTIKIISKNSKSNAQ